MAANTPSIILFDNKSYTGPTVRLDKPSSSVSVGNGVSALIVCDGVWELYSGAQFTGNVWTVCSSGGPDGDGLYPDYPNYFTNDTIKSARPAQTKDGGIILFLDANYGGKDATRFWGTTSDLGTLAGKVSSMIVCDGEWELYTSTDFQGQVFKVLATGGPDPALPGMYPTPGPYFPNDAIRSIRLVGAGTSRAAGGAHDAVGAGTRRAGRA